MFVSMLYRNFSFFKVSFMVNKIYLFGKVFWNVIKNFRKLLYYLENIMVKKY